MYGNSWARLHQALLIYTLQKTSNMAYTTLILNRKGILYCIWIWLRTVNNISSRFITETVPKACLDCFSLFGNLYKLCKPQGKLTGSLHDSASSCMVSWHLWQIIVLLVLEGCGYHSPHLNIMIYNKTVSQPPGQMLLNSVKSFIFQAWITTKIWQLGIITWYYNIFV